MPEHSVSIKQERGFVRLIVTPEPDGGTGLPSTYSSATLAEQAAARLQRERGWNWGGSRNGTD